MNNDIDDKYPEYLRDNIKPYDDSISHRQV